MSLAVFLVSLLISFVKIGTTTGTIAFCVACAAVFYDGRTRMMKDESFLHPRMPVRNLDGTINYKEIVNKIDVTLVLVGAIAGFLTIKLQFGAAIVIAALAAAAYCVDIDTKYERGAIMHPAFLVFVFSIFPVVKGLKGTENLLEVIVKGPAIWNIAAMLLMIIELIRSYERGKK